MANSLQFALTNANAGMEDEFRQWYTGAHLQHGLNVPGVLAGQMFERVAGPFPAGKHNFMMIWEFDRPAYALEQLAAVKGGDELPISPALDFANVQPPTMWIRASVNNTMHPEHDSASRGPLVLGLLNAVDDRDDEFAAALLNGELTRLADMEGLYKATLLTLTEEQIRGSARKYRFGLLLELADEKQGLNSLQQSLPQLPHLDKERWLAPVFRPVAARLSSPD